MTSGARVVISGASVKKDEKEAEDYREPVPEPKPEPEPKPKPEPIVPSHIKKFLSAETPKVSEIVSNRPKLEPKPVPKLSIVPKTEPKKVNKPPAKQKGSTHKPRAMVKKAILSGAAINYDSLQKSTGAGRGTVSAVIKELSGDGKIVKTGKKWELKKEARKA